MFGSYQMYFIVKFVASCKNEDDAKLSYEVAHRLILKLAEYVTEKAANPVKVSRNIMINHETHLNGSKHLKKMKQLGQEDVSTGTNSTSKKVLAATAKSVKNVPKFVSLETKLHLERRGEPVIICQRLQSTTLL